MTRVHFSIVNEPSTYHSWGLFVALRSVSAKLESMMSEPRSFDENRPALGMNAEGTLRMRDKNEEGGREEDDICDGLSRSCKERVTLRKNE